MNNGKYKTAEYIKKQADKTDRLFGKLKEHTLTCKICEKVFLSNTESCASIFKFNPIEDFFNELRKTLYVIPSSRADALTRQIQSFLKSCLRLLRPTYEYIRAFITCPFAVRNSLE